MRKNGAKRKTSAKRAVPKKKTVMKNAAKGNVKKAAGAKQARKSNIKLTKKITKTPKMARGIEVKETATEEKTRGKKGPGTAYIYPPEEVERAIAELQGNGLAIGYLKKNVSKRALEVINSLSAPKTDEALADELDMKINAVRRILNIMQGYGITNYYIAKNVNGWLSFAWYINVSKLRPFLDTIERTESKKPMVSDDCNDYFICNNCYKDSRLIFTFEAAFEQGFKCSSCESGLTMIDREKASQMITDSQQNEEAMLSKSLESSVDREGV